ncbi:hypothetical protein B0T20DRAFT_194000 [Sordaria brevicollis]|uniref:Store-operated calcium entry-associated regulatory factor n=1 Tax=Sordaria brevicollis TaxID=83679 RepID=A0AAE0PFZ6_SORBR|nr:hypothetical protein B0T20DRAFT_194000 [Sordaria brevicollis]
MRLLDPSSPSLGAAALLFLSALPNGLNGAEAAKSKAKDAVLLSNIKSLTFSPDKMTTGRRLPPIPQLTCLPSPSSPLCKLAQPHISVMRCVNAGSRYGKEDIQWSCTVPSLPTTLQLGSTDVVCEGYDGPEDDYVLKGSCGVEYRLVLTEEGRRKYGDGFGDGGGWGDGEGTGWSGVLFGMLFVGVLGWIIYSACVQAGANRRLGNNGERRGWGGGGGPGFGGGPGGGPGDGGDWDEPPPPYPGYGNKPSGSQQQQPGQQQQGWRPGFWSGVAGGAAAGYLAGQRGRGRDDRDRNRGYNYGSTWGSSSGSRNRSWGSSSSPSYDNGGSSGSTHESTGFGSTSRR